MRGCTVPRTTTLVGDRRPENGERGQTGKKGFGRLAGCGSWGGGGGQVARPCAVEHGRRGASEPRYFAGTWSLITHRHSPLRSRPRQAPAVIRCGLRPAREEGSGDGPWCRGTWVAVGCLGSSDPGHQPVRPDLTFWTTGTCGFGLAPWNRIMWGTGATLRLSLTLGALASRTSPADRRDKSSGVGSLPAHRHGLANGEPYQNALPAQPTSIFRPPAWSFPAHAADNDAQDAKAAVAARACHGI